MYASPDRRLRRPAAHAKALTVGSLSGQVEKLHVGESALKSSETGALRSTCPRAIVNVVRRQPCRKYDLD
jgi:hypothetical protein